VNLSLLLDLLLVVFIFGYIAYGVAVGLNKSFLAMAGLIAGVVVALLVTPVVSNVIPIPDIRVMASLATWVAIIALGHAIGHTISRKWHVKESNSAPRLVDRIAGGFAAGLLIALVVSTSSLKVGHLGSPILSRAFAQSEVVQTLNDITPVGVKAQISRLYASSSSERVPVFTEDFGSDTAVVPEVVVGNATLSAAAESVVRIVGNSYECGQGRSGTGFVVANDRIVTNAHVVAGVENPVIESLNGQVLVGSVVYFDVRDDLAVIAVTGLDATPLNKGTIAIAGETTELMGYSHGGPIVATVGTVQSTRIFNSPNIYRLGKSPRQIYTLVGKVSRGDSGGPVLNLAGEFVGIIFARATDRANVGYAMTLTELDPILSSASEFTTSVSSGDCIRD
jgi:S1-C subfamily serine protease